MPDNSSERQFRKLAPSIPGIGSGDVSPSVAAIAARAFDLLLTRNLVNAIPRKNLHAAFRLSETGDGVSSC